MDLCYESSLFQTGLFATGKQALIRQSAPGKLAVLTSCPPGEMEEFRLVIGVMPILSLNDTQKFGYPAIAGDRRRMIRLRREQMPRLWSIVHPRNVNRGLVHYLEDREVTRILGTLGKVGVSLSRVNDGLSDADVSQSSDEAIEEFVERRLRSEREFFLRNHRAADLVRKRAGGKCAVCERNVFAHYLVDVIEAHHREGGCFPGELRSIRVGDLAALCPTCHRALHRRSKDPLRPMSVEEFKEALVPF
ncbi:MAG TPA: hypothetical protein VJ801_16125 [Polyangia bacterium]|jgi:Predicted restriction endonuclease|nr:hypothetical protein [Polyangia bacterium]